MGQTRSSARAVRCWVKSRNERNPRFLLPADNAGDAGKTAGEKPEEGVDDVKSSWPFRPGLNTRYNWRYKPLPSRNAERIGKSMSQFGSRSATPPGGVQITS